MTGETTSHLTKLVKNTSKVIGYALGTTVLLMGSKFCHRS